MTIEDLNEIQKESMRTLGWYAHCVPNGDLTPYGFNYHTHGMEHSFNHQNFQIVLPIRADLAHILVSALIDEVKKGVRFEPNIEYDGIIQNGYKVKFLEAKECGRSVLRLLIPDKEGKYEGQYADQLLKLDNQEGIPEHEKVYQID